MNKEELISLLRTMANELGYDLEKTTEKRQAWKPEDEKIKKLENMSSKDLIKEIKLTESDISSLNSKNEKIKDCVTKFMNKVGPSETTRDVFSGSNFNSKKLKVRNHSLAYLTNYKDYLEDLLSKATEKEMITNFEGDYPDFNGKVEGIAVRQTPVGKELIVSCFSSLDKDESDVEDTESEKEKSDTTS